MNSSLSVILATLAFAACSAAPASEQATAPDTFPPFKGHLVARLPRGYKVAALDIDRDGRLDIVGLATNPSRLAWYRNPDWDSHVLTSRAKAYIDLAPCDIDGDGRIDLAVAHEFGMSRTDSGGLVSWLKCPQDPTREWPMYAVGSEPTSHRIKWADTDGDGRKELIDAPIMGRHSKGPLWDVGVRFGVFLPPGSPASEPWNATVIDDRLTVLHGIAVVDWNRDGRDDLLTASFEGVNLYQSSGQGGTIAWEKRRLGRGEQGDPSRRGSSEIAPGRLGRAARFLAAIEPWHGDKVVVYRPGPEPTELWQRTVIDTTFNEGHALTCADLDGDGDDEIVAGYRGPGQSLYVYDCVDRQENKWRRIPLDEGDMAASGVDAADVNGDGRLDVICVGTATSNIKWYENRGPGAPEDSNVTPEDTPPEISARPSAALPAWEFDSEQEMRTWQPNAHLADVKTANGVVFARGIDWDPFLLSRDVTLETRPCQYVVIRIRASRAGIGELFWSGQLEGRYGGLTERKKLRFSVSGENQWQEIVLLPFWHTEGMIRQLRLDLYEGADFEIDYIRVEEWGRSASQASATTWKLEGDASAWQVHPAASEFFAPAAELDVSDKGWVTVELVSDTDGVASILWARQDAPGLRSEEFLIRGDGRKHFYYIRMDGRPGWAGPIVAFGIRLPEEANIHLDQIRIDREPSGPGELEVNYFGFESGVNRAGRACSVLVQVVNRGGRTQGIREVQLHVPEGLRLLSGPETPGHPGLEHGDVAPFTWEVCAPRPGHYLVRVGFSGKGAIPPAQQVSLEFSDPPLLPPAAYVPQPRPVQTDIEVCAFYFPGWESDAKWDCVRRVAPGRKPLLGYCDESNPECVDWQIKWAVENGISCFLVDWYWVQGRQQLTHWFDAYRRARYQDLLKVAIMWANHNPPGTHSADDWRKVTKHWIERYFPLQTYYRINGKPAVFIWDSQAIRDDLGGSDAVRAAFDESQAMARAAGFGGITLIALGYNFSKGHIQALKEEGYFGVTTYHEWGAGIDGQVARKLFHYEDVVRESPAAWKQRDEAADGLTYYPLVDTGWDSRPWHGYRAMVIQGRSPRLFAENLRQARRFCKENGKDMLILGPVNEWGEGSYIEPCTEFGFEMLEAVRRTFATGPADAWPLNLSPADVGLGPYDFQAAPTGEMRAP